MKKLGERRDGKRVNNIDFMHKIMVQLKPDRCDSDVFINQKMDVTELVNYMENKKKEDKDLTYFHLFSCVIAKIIYNKPLLNRFIVNKNFYDRNSVSIGFVAKVDYSDEAKEIMSVIEIEGSDTLSDVEKKILSAVSKVRNNKESGSNNVVSMVGKLPKWLITIVVKLVKFMDRHDLLPESIIKDNLYYSTVLVSNLGSIHSGAIYHNLTNFGTSSILVTIGEITKEKTLLENGKEEERYICEFGINLDERIADGVYMVKAVKLMQDIFDNPKLLEGRIDDKIEGKTEFKY